MARFRIVPERSQVWIDARSSLHPIHSRTSGLDGVVEVAVGKDGRLDLATAPRAHLSLPVARLASGNPLQDREMRRRIEARRFPTIDGELTGMRAGATSDHYVVRGDITFKGVTRPYEEEMAIASVDDRTLRLEGEAIFDIRDFGMQPPRILMLRVEPEVKVRVEIVAELDD